MSEKEVSEKTTDNKKATVRMHKAYSDTDEWNQSDKKAGFMRKSRGNVRKVEEILVEMKGGVATDGFWVGSGKNTITF